VGPETITSILFSSKIKTFLASQDVTSSRQLSNDDEKAKG